MMISERFLDASGAKYEFYSEESALLDRVAHLMAEEKVVGWFQGRMEYGPRALGCRSIIGDPRSPRMQQKMNLKIKFRESFRPFAPCVLQEYVDKVFEMRPNEESPYMLQVAPVREEWRTSLSSEDKLRMQDPDLRIRVAVPRSRLPAITHVDYSARIQTVDARATWTILSTNAALLRLTECPVIVNTSFNIRGEPIVGSPEDAYRCFLATEMECLVLENYVLLKDQQPSHSLLDTESYKASYALD